MRPLRAISVCGAVVVAAGLVGSGGGAGVYVVRAGDNLSTVAAHNHVSLAALAAANGIGDPNRIRIGQRLVIPSPPPPAPPPGPPPTTHVVRPGETLAQIAAQAHTTVASLAAIHGI